MTTDPSHADKPAKRGFFKRLFGLEGSRTGWRVLASNEIGRLADELKLVEAPAQLRQVSDERANAYVKDVDDIVRKHLDRAKVALVSVGLVPAFRNWYSGAALDEAWLNIHRASEALLMIQSSGNLIGELVQTDAAFRATIQPSDPRYASLAHML